MSSQVWWGGENWRLWKRMSACMVYDMVWYGYNYQLLPAITSHDINTSHCLRNWFGEGLRPYQWRYFAGSTVEIWWLWCYFKEYLFRLRLPLYVVNLFREPQGFIFCFCRRCGTISVFMLCKTLERFLLAKWHRSQLL